MIRIHTPGFPRIGAQRELKQALEAYWAGRSSAGELRLTALELRARHWQVQREAGLDLVTVGDFSLYDHVADHIVLFGCEPSRFRAQQPQDALERYFLMARGQGAAGCGCAGQQALEMTKWFDSNYHYLVPEFDAETGFALQPQALLQQVGEAQALGHAVKVALLGPLSFLWLGKSVQPGFDRLQLLEQLLPVYRQLLAALAAAGVQWVQLDEPILGLDLPGPWAAAFEPAYHQLQGSGVSLLLATWFSTLQGQLALACRLPVAGLHIDAVRAPQDVGPVCDWLPQHRVLSLGLIDGRNIWRADLEQCLQLAQQVRQRRTGELWLAPSCSLLHVPFSLAQDAGVDAEVRPWLAGAVEKLQELAVLRRGLLHGEAAIADSLYQARLSRQQRQLSPRVQVAAVRQRLQTLAPDADQRAAPFAQRWPQQQARLQLPLYPTTTIGSFPQTPEVRQARAAWRRGQLDELAYVTAMREHIRQAVAEQEALQLDVLVHGEAERNDMVEYFAGLLPGFTVSDNGWVQSYGSRCVKPPILFGDVSRPQPVTLEWSVYAQSLTERPMKAMLTGPVTLLQWSFVRDDQPREQTLLQLALAVRDEVADLDAVGLPVIQIDEPALREGLPLRQAPREAWLQQATRAFRLASSVARPATQIHSHMCYAEFADILPWIAALDVDVITLETSRSGAALLEALRDFDWPSQIGPGVYDIHSPQVPSVASMRALLQLAGHVLQPRQLWVNPDCGLKTRAWPETRAALANMVQAAAQLRASAAAEGGQRVAA